MPSGQRPLLFTAATGALCFLCGCQLGLHGPLDAWVTSDMINVTSATKQFNDILVFNQTEQQVNLFAAANETVSFQVVVDAGQEAVGGLKVHCADLATPMGETIEAENLSAFSAQPVRVTHYPPWYLRLVDAVPQPVDFYDALVPLSAGGAPVDVDGGARAVLWIDLYVPRGTGEGQYATTLKIASNTHEEKTFNLNVEVYNFVLPDARPIAAVGGFSNTSLYRTFIRRGGKPYAPIRMDRRDELIRKGLVLMRQLMRLSHTHRLDLFDKAIRPSIKRDMLGKTRLDWSDYDAIVKPYLDGSAFDDRIGCPAWPMPLSDTWPQPQYYGGLDSKTYAASVGAILDECKKHFSDVLSQRNQMFFWPYRDQVNQAGYARHARMARIARSVDTDTPILSQLPFRPPALTGWRLPDDFARLGDIRAAPAEFFDPASPGVTPSSDHPLTGAWLSPGIVPYLPSLGIIATPADVRAIPWFAMKYNCTALFLPEVLHWDGDPFVGQAGAGTRLFYPGKPLGIDAVLPSIRLKRLRRGLQDIAYLWLLRQHRRGEAAEAVLHAMTRYAGLVAAGDNYLDCRLDGWARDPKTWQMARRLLAEEVAAAVRGDRQQPDHQLLAQRIAWRQFNHRVHRIRLEQARSRVTPAKTPNRLRITVMLDLYNEYTASTNTLVKLGSGQVTAGWQAVNTEAVISPFPPATRRTVTLTAECTHLPTEGFGKIVLPVSITTDMTRQQQLQATVAFMTAGMVNKPITIDGNLRDWPMRGGNSAGMFKLLGRRGQSGSGQANRQTLVFVLRDKKNLYIAFRCTEPNMDKLVSTPTNIIHYEQLMACGEDLVEIILDPGMRAQSPEELYHIIVKPNGVLLAERGVRTSPPLGAARLWPVAVQLAVGKHDKLWVVEMAIPLSAMPGAEKQQFWGVNFTRFATQGAEASSWSQAPRYFYDPRNLGTIFFPPLESKP